MWVDSRIRAPTPFVREDVFDGPEGEHDEAEGGAGGVEAVGAVDDEADPAVESSVAGVVHAEAHRGQDAGTALAGVAPFPIPTSSSSRAGPRCPAYGGRFITMSASSCFRLGLALWRLPLGVGSG